MAMLHVKTMQMSSAVAKLFERPQISRRLCTEQKTSKSNAGNGCAISKTIHQGYLGNMNSRERRLTADNHITRQKLWRNSPDLSGLFIDPTGT